MEDIVWKVVAGIATFSTLGLWREYTTRVKELEKRVKFLYETKWPSLEDRTTALELFKKSWDVESAKVEKRFNKTMRVLNAMLWAIKSPDNSDLDIDELFKD